jgi:hypothetical protein
MHNTDLNCNLTATEHISQQISRLKDWRGRTISQVRKLILEAEPDIEEKWKWGIAVWSKGGNICYVIPYKNCVKLSFFNGASLKDPKGVFNADTEGTVSRAIEFKRGEIINELAFKELIREAITFNLLSDLYKSNEKNSPTDRSKHEPLTESMVFPG